ncbi:MAG TPA: hypothetical protein VH561_04640 [Micromonosporaceae bacterium]
MSRGPNRRSLPGRQIRAVTALCPHCDRPLIEFLNQMRPGDDHDRLAYRWRKNVLLLQDPAHPDTYHTVHDCKLRPRLPIPIATAKVRALLSTLDIHETRRVAWDDVQR